ncbi:targeting protein for Xklp2 homolog [Aricia agestis]|uniref:targeting protein for Xklp2 homolog n=1 Tax=Aricia agestis TaxID=91739 RepID=UPI001C2029E3|nr:targeting protein for Xklp2 homolog [Aricia agestis]
MARRFVNNFRGEMYFSPNGNLHVKEEPLTPKDDFEKYNNLDLSFENECAGMKKSLSMNDIAALRRDMVKLEFSEHSHDRYTQNSQQDLSRTKFVSMAEAIYHFQRDTPDRFHSTRPRTFRPNPANSGSRSGLTVPQSPMLRSKSRSRPHHILSQKEREEMELEEIKKFKLKANPIPKAVITGPSHLPEVQKKPATVPEPFKLTEVPKKIFQSPEHISFKARPAPKHILESSKVPVKATVQPTKPKSPKFHYKRANSADQIKLDFKPLQQTKKTEKCDKIRHGPVKPEPFSFERRDEEMRKRHEERIKRQIEEERKLATQFKAQPLPKAVKKRMQCVTTGSSVSNASSENKENHIKFEAKPPVVLYKEPFKPVLKPVQLVQPVPFALTTEKRAVEREKFEKQIKEKEEEMEKIRKQREEEQREAEERAVAEMRAKLVHHPKPVPHINPFVPEKSVLPITVPETPKFVRRLKQQ